MCAGDDGEGGRVVGGSIGRWVRGRGGWCVQRVVDDECGGGEEGMVLLREDG